LKLHPGFASVHTQAKLQFTTVETGVTGEPVNWQVNGIPNGNATLGTITNGGLYTAPSAVPAGTTVAVTATIAGAEPASTTVAIITGILFYVSTSGNDTNPGTLASPWRSIQHAANQALAGDTVYIRGGTYHESVNLPHSGSSTAGSIIFQSYPGEVAVIDGSGVACCGDSIQGLFNITGNESYLILDGLQIQNYASNNVSNEPAGVYISGSGSYLQILNCVVHGITETAGPNGNAHGIGVYGTLATPLSNITVSGNNVFGNKTGNSETIIFDGNVVGFTASGNLVHDTDNIGIDATGFYGTGPSGHDQARNGVIQGNSIYNITSINNPAYSGYGADGIYCDGCKDVVIQRNLVYDCDLNIEAASENAHQLTSYVTIRDNVIYGANLAGISIGGYDATRGGSQYITIVNNTLFNNNQQNGGGEFQVQYFASHNLFENNIVYAGTQGVLLNSYTASEPSPVGLNYNIYYTTASPQWVWQGTTHSTFASYQAASTQDQHSHFENPGLISAASPYNFDLQTSSPARNAGNFQLGSADYGILDFAERHRTVGATIDIGAYEQ
jgi:hypothetical protein